ncbi:glutathione S-transferase family protein [Algihabitans albus]|uniref:glutathione S-transferase family protein n=1 Tax=Algihabitans albus TaxID=2164067 RepID=UPI000E5CF090|nr:glutathione S-transferase family protein [Algihabitans albus]
MGLLVEGVWHDTWYDTKSTGGRFRRQDSAFRNWITRDGSPGPSGDGGFEAEAGRYHLYVSLACPWAHRTLIFRKLKGLERVISTSTVHYHMAENGWEFRPTDSDNQGAGGTSGYPAGDPLHGFDFAHQLYTKAKPDYSGRVTVPILWDKQRRTIVSNESAEIIRMLNAAFSEIGDASAPDFYPEALRGEIDAVNAQVYDRINNGVYKAGFATEQSVYEEAFEALFACLDGLEARLARNRYLVGETLTEADWRLFTTLVRFDPVYVGHFKCNRDRLVDFPNLWAYTRELFQVPGVAETVNFTHIKRHYYGSHATVNPTGVVPSGLRIDFMAPHDRDRLSRAAE